MIYKVILLSYTIQLILYKGMFEYATILLKNLHYYELCLETLVQLDVVNADH